MDDIDNLDMELSTYLAGQKRAYDNWKKIKFRLLIISKFSKYSALRRPLEDQSGSEDEVEVVADPTIMKKYIIIADSRNKLIWNMFTNVMYMVSFFTFPFVIAFNFEMMEEMVVFEFFLDLIMLCDIATEFITTRERDGRKITKMQEITFLYMKSTFVFDTMACLPGLITLERNPKWYMFKVFRYLQMPRFFD